MGKTFKVVWGPWRFYLPIGVKTLIAFLITLSFLVGGIFYYLDRIFIPELEGKAMESLSSKLEGAWRIYYARMDQMKYGMLQAVSEDYVLKAIKEKDSVFLQRLLRGYARNRPYVDLWAVVDPRGMVIGRRNGRTGDMIEIGGVISEALRKGEVIQSTEVVGQDLLNLESPDLGGRVEREGLMQIVVVPAVEDGRVLGAFVTGILLNGYEWLPEAIYRYLVTETAIFASVLKESKVVTATPLPKSLFSPLVKVPVEITKPLSEKRRFQGKVSLGGSEAFVVADPIINRSGEAVGGLALTIHGEEVRGDIEAVKREIMVFTAFAMVVSLIFAGLAYRDTVWPIRAIVGAMEEAASGNLKVRTEIKTKDEFETIGSHLNSMLESIEKREERLERFNELSKLLVASLDPETLLSTALAKVVELTDSQMGIVYLYDDKENVLRPISSCGVGGDNLRVLKVGEGMPGLCALEKKSVHIELPREEGFSLDLGYEKVSPRGVAWFAMCYKDKLLGVLAIGSLHPYDREEIHHLEYLVNQIAIALDNAIIHKEVERLSITDPLTGLYNRRYFFSRLEEAFKEAKRYNFPLSLIMIDVDDFKAINDTFGHEKGDTVLRGLARILKTRTRSSDIWGRYGGEELIGFLSHCEGKGALETAEKIRSIIETTRFNGIDRRVTVSVGISSYPSHDVESLDDLLKKADEALYRAKRSGKNGVEVHL